MKSDECPNPQGVFGCHSKSTGCLRMPIRRNPSKRGLPRKSEDTLPLSTALYRSLPLSTALYRSLPGLLRTRSGGATTGQLLAPITNPLAAEQVGFLSEGTFRGRNVRPFASATLGLGIAFVANIHRVSSDSTDPPQYPQGVFGLDGPTRMTKPITLQRCIPRRHAFHGTAPRSPVATTHLRGFPRGHAFQGPVGPPDESP